MQEVLIVNNNCCNYIKQWSSKESPRSWLPGQGKWPIWKFRAREVSSLSFKHAWLPSRRKMLVRKEQRITLAIYKLETVRSSWKNRGDTQWHSILEWRLMRFIKNKGVLRRNISLILVRAPSIIWLQLKGTEQINQLIHINLKVLLWGQILRADKKWSMKSQHVLIIKNLLCWQ